MIKLLQHLIIFVLLAVPTAKGDDAFDWMGTSLGGLGSLFGCLEVPDFTGFKQGSVTLDLSNPGVWQSTGMQVQKGKLLKFSWNSAGATGEPRKYLVLYQIDPRFDRPQIFIKTYNYTTQKYEANDFPSFNTNPVDKDLAAIAFPRMQDYINYTNFSAGRKKIRVDPGDVINLKFITKGEFFGAVTDNNILTRELGPNNILAASALYTFGSSISGGDNRVLYGTADKICNIIDPTRGTICSGSGADTRYIGNNNMALVGRPFTASDAKTLMNQVRVCSYPVTDSSAPCYYRYATDMIMKINNRVIKPAGAQLVEISGYGLPFYYYKSDVGGDLDFGTELPISGMFDQSSMMNDWLRFTDFNSFSSYISSVSWGAKFIHFGSYVMTIEVGSGDRVVSDSDQTSIKVEYVITDGSAPSNSTSGTSIGHDFAGDAERDGFLWARVLNPNGYVQGTINVSYAAYTGTTWFSDIIYNGAVKPITDQFLKFTKDFYTKLTKNAALQRILKACLTLYVVVFGLMFVMGAVKVTAAEAVTRIFKIAVVSVVISEDSWRFFNEYLFSAFLNGTNYLMTNIVGVTSSKANIFGFIDPIFDKFTSGRIWGLLFIQLLQIHNGLTFIAIISIYSLLVYFRAVLEVIVSYLIAFVGLSVMIALAPFFIILMLFEKTKSLFDNWLSTLFSYMIQPAILLIFFLLIDQIISEQLLKVIVRACWGTLIPIKIGLDLSHLGIPLDFSFTLPFLPGIPFFVPDVPAITAANVLSNATPHFLVLFTTALLLFSYCLMSYGLVNYITIVVGQLTNVTPARQEGNFQAPSNPTASIMSDIKSATQPIKDLALSPAHIFKDKVIDQNYRARPGAGGGSKNEYTNKIFASRDDGKGSEEKDE